MIPIAPELAAEFEQLRAAARSASRSSARIPATIALPPDPAALSDLVLNVAKAVDQAVAEVVEMAEACSRARRRGRALVRQLAEERNNPMR